MKTIPIKEIILEAIPLIAPAFIPSMQTSHARTLLDNVKTRKDLNDFKKDYSGFADYKTYDDTLHNIKRGSVYGAGVGATLGGVLLAADQGFRDDLSMTAGLSAVPILTGTIGGAVNGVIRNNILKQPTLYDRVKNKENSIR